MISVTFPEETTHVFDPVADLNTLRTESALLKPVFTITYGNRWSISEDEHYEKIDEILYSIPRGKTLSFGYACDPYRKHDSFTKNIDGSWSSGYGLHDCNWNIINVMFHHACGKPLPNLKLTGKAIKLITDGEVHPCLPSKNPKLKPTGLNMDQLKSLPVGTTAELERSVLIKQSSGKWLMWDKVTAKPIAGEKGFDFLEFQLRRCALYGIYIPK